MKNLVLAGAVCSLASGVVAAGLDDNEISLNAGLSYQLSDAWTLGLGFAQAARGKEIGDGFTIDEYLYDGEDIPVVAGDLKPEKVTSIEASAAYSANNLEARFSVYQSVIAALIEPMPEANSLHASPRSRAASFFSTLVIVGFRPRV